MSGEESAPTRSLVLADLSAGSIFKIGFACSGLFWLLPGLLFGSIALLGGAAVFWGGAPVYGPLGFAVALGLSAIFTILSALAFTIGGVLARLVPGLGDLVLRSSDTEA